LIQHYTGTVTLSFRENISVGCRWKPSRIWRKQSRGVEICVALVLFAAAGLKAYQLFTNSNHVVMPGLIHNQAVIAAIIQIELWLSIWLWVGGFARLRWVAALLCFSFFSMVASYEALHSMPSCGCFGNVKIPPAAAAVFDGFAVAALLFARPRGRFTEATWPSRRLVFGSAAIAIFSTGALWTGYFLKATPVATHDDLTVLEPEAWLNHPFPVLDEIGGGDPLRRGRWLVVLYHFDCESCRQAIPKYRAMAARYPKDLSTPGIAFIAMPPLAPSGEDPVEPSPAYLRLSLSRGHDWFATTPIMAALQDGTVLFVADGKRAVDPPSVAQWR
jgi:hypothetical protein